jgi:hypothetical protein
MVMTAIAGKYCPERGPEPFPLLRQLGIAPPSGAYVLGETNVWAEATEDHALFAKGSRLKMFTLADQQQALQSDLVRIRENFWSWAFRWIPQTDYFGYYRDHPAADGKVLARFASGGAALSRHAVGKGEVLVFWGMPDYQPALYTGMMARAAAWAGVADPRKGSPVPYTLEGDNAKLGRHYALMCQETPGTYRQKLPAVPDGDWFLDDMVGQQRLGTYTGAELRDPGLELTFAPGCSPLKVVRMAPAKTMNAEWVRKYRQPAAAAP